MVCLETTLVLNWHSIDFRNWNYYAWASDDLIWEYGVLLRWFLKLFSLFLFISLFLKRLKRCILSINFNKEKYSFRQNKNEKTLENFFKFKLWKAYIWLVFLIQKQSSAHKGKSVSYHLMEVLACWVGRAQIAEAVIDVFLTPRPCITRTTKAVKAIYD